MPEKKVEQPKEEKVLVSWVAPARPFKRRTREFYVTILSMAGLAGAILFLVEGIMPVVLLGALLFLFYILSSVKPDDAQYQITTKGIRFAGKLTEWEKLGKFWLINRWGVHLVVFQVFGIPGRLELVLDETQKGKIAETLKKYLVNEEIPPDVFDKAVDWISKKLPQS